MKSLQELNSQYTAPSEPKRYYFEPIPNKKTGFVYYVRYGTKGHVIQSRWTTHTNNYDAAVKFAIENRDRLIAAYYARQEKKEPQSALYSTLKKYYAPHSKYIEVDRARGRAINDATCKVYHRFILNKFIPYLRKHRIKKITEIKTSLLVKFQDELLIGKMGKKGKRGKPMKPQTINRDMSGLSVIFEHLIGRDGVEHNPFNNVPILKVTKKDRKKTGCYHVDLLRGVFNKSWEDPLSYILNLIHYSMNLRPVEIENIRLRDITKIQDVYYLDVPVSKTDNGIRKVPMHNFVYENLMSYAKDNGKTEPDDLVFKMGRSKEIGATRYRKAYIELGKHLGYTEERLKSENISFYSGRHYWKTTMKSECLSYDLEEFFMGHKVGSGVAEIYYHDNKKGQDNLVKAAHRIFEILDRVLFL